MADLSYAIEYLFDDASPNNPSAFIQLKQSPTSAVWMDRIRKQDYTAGNALGDALFAIDGITELSIQPFRVWFSMSPIYSWDEVVDPILLNVVNHLSLDGSVERSGSPITLDNTNNRLEP